MADEVAAPKVEAPAVNEFVVEHELSSPIMSYGESIKVLKLRKPTGADLLAVGSPVILFPYTEPPRIEHDWPKVVAMVARLSGVPSSSVAEISTRDLSALAWEISHFFTPAA